MGVFAERIGLRWLFIVVVMLPMGAVSGGWADFSGVFPLYPCQDGWLGCVSEDGDVRSSQLQWDDSGRPLPSDMRVDWDGNPTQTFSPFVGLSAYSGEEDEIVEVPPPAEVSAEPLEAVADIEETQEDTVTAPTVAVVNADERVQKETVKSSTEKQARNDNQETALEKKHEKVAQKKEAAQEVAQEPVAVVAVNSAPEKKVRETPAADVTCDDLKALEMGALSGAFSKGQIVCLNRKMSRSGKQTEKVAISKLLMNDVWIKGDKSKWMQLAESHLANIDKSDPDLVYKYVNVLSKKGPSRAKGVVRWAGVALENKTRWSGDTYKKRVNKLLKLKTLARLQLYKKAAEKTVSDGTASRIAQEESAKNSYKTAAREWYEYTKQANLDGSKALQACISAAGFESYCTGR
jgi:hypothetical protein